MKVDRRSVPTENTMQDQKSVFSIASAYYAALGDGRSTALARTYSDVAALDARPVTAHAIRWACSTLASHYAGATGADAARAATLAELGSLADADDRVLETEGGVAIFGGGGTAAYRQRSSDAIAYRDVVSLWQRVEADARDRAFDARRNGDDEGAFDRWYAISQRWDSEAQVLDAVLRDWCQSPI